MSITSKTDNKLIFQASELDYLIELTTSQDMTYRYFNAGLIDVEKYINLVMKSELCPRCSIVKIVISEVDNALKEKE